jgi:hypothetical protein
VHAVLWLCMFALSVHTMIYMQGILKGEVSLYH